MNVYIQLTSAGTNTGPFSLYSDVDGYVTSFETDVTRSSLLNGYTSTLVPNGTSSIQIVSDGECDVSVYLDVTLTTTTTSTSTTSTTSTTFTTTSTTSTTSSTSSTTSTSTSSTSSTTTTTTTIPVQQMLIGRSLDGNTQMDAEALCGNLYTDNTDGASLQVVYFRSNSTIPATGDSIFTNPECTLVFTLSDGTWWGAVTDWDITLKNTYDYSVQISSSPGTVLDETVCTTTTTTSSTTTTTTTAAPYHLEVSVNDTTYDEPNEVNIPYAAVSTVNTPTKSGFNYLFFSIPIDKSFILEDSLGTDVTSTFSIDVASGTGGVDSRAGYQDNYIYKSDDVFATSFSTMYTLTII